MRDLIKAVALTLFLLGMIGLGMWLAARLLPPNTVPVSRAAQVFVRNDTLFVCDRGCLFVEPRRRGCGR